MEKTSKSIPTWYEPERPSILEGVQFKGTATYQIFEELTKPMTLPEFSEYSAEQKKLGNPYVVGAEEDWAIRTAMANSGNKKLIEKFRGKLRNNWIRVLSAIDWFPTGYAHVLHNVGTSDEYIKKSPYLIGEDGFIHEVESKKLLEKVIGENDVKEINRISNILNNTLMYQWRVNSKPPEKIRTSVVLVAYSGGLGLYCDRDPLDQYPAFRVLRVD